MAAEPHRCRRAGLQACPEHTHFRVPLGGMLTGARALVDLPAKRSHCMCGHRPLQTGEGTVSMPATSSSDDGRCAGRTLACARATALRWWAPCLGPAWATKCTQRPEAAIADAMLRESEGPRPKASPRVPLACTAASTSKMERLNAPSF